MRLFLQIEEEIGEVVQTFPQERIQHYSVERIVDVLVPDVVERIGEADRGCDSATDPGDSWRCFNWPCRRSWRNPARGEGR